MTIQTSLRHTPPSSFPQFSRTLVLAAVALVFSGIAARADLRLVI